MHGAHPRCISVAARGQSCRIQLWSACRVQFFHQIGVQCWNGLAHTDFMPAAVRATRARCASVNICLPGGVWCAAVLARAATLPCGKILRGCSHSVWGSILVSFIHPLLHQVWSPSARVPRFPEISLLPGQRVTKIRHIMRYSTILPGTALPMAL